MKKFEENRNKKKKELHFQLSGIIFFSFYFFNSLSSDRGSAPPEREAK